MHFKINIDIYKPADLPFTTNGENILDQLFDIFSDNLFQKISHFLKLFSYYFSFLGVLKHRFFRFHSLFFQLLSKN